MDEQITNPQIQIIYVSAAVEAFSKNQLEELLVSSRERNHANEITGMLVYDNGSFMQVLEGAESNVLALLTKIRKDRRHKNFRILSHSHLIDRELKDWSMGFVDVAEISTQHDGFTPYQAVQSTMWDCTTAKSYIRMFQQGKWRQAS